MPTIDEVLRYGLAAHRVGKFDIAENAYRQVLNYDPAQPDALHLMAVLDSNLGRHQQALEHIARAIAVDGSHPGYRLTLADALSNVGRGEEAIESYRQAIAIAGDLMEAHAGLAAALHRATRYGEALEHYRLALALGLTDDEHLENMGTAAISAGNSSLAADALWRAAALRPAKATIQTHLGIALQWLRRRSDAANRYRLALALDPDFDDAQIRLGQLAFGDGDVVAAVAAYSAVMRRNPDHAEAHRAYVQSLPLLPGYDAATILAERRRWSDRHARPIEQKAVASGACIYANDRDPDRRLRVAYLGGSQLFGSTVIHTFLPLLEAHDHSQVEIFCISDLVKGQEDGFTERFRAVADKWRMTVGQSDEQVAAVVRNDRIDLLVDLTGHMGGPRVLVFAHRPAPVQVALYATMTTGQVGYDYLIADDRLVPPSLEHGYSEEIVRVPFGYVFRPQLGIPDVAQSPAARHPGRITFVSMNTLAKVSDQSVALWARILLQVPHARLLIKGETFGASEGRAAMLARFRAHGIADDRLDLRAPAADYVAYLRMFEEIDIALDSVPYNGVTTTCETLWMGVPVISLASELLVSRYGLLILSAIDLGNCVAYSEDEYVAKAVGLSTDVNRLAQWRQSMRDRLARSPLHDAPASARALEVEYRNLWRRWCRPI